MVLRKEENKYARFHVCTPGCTYTTKDKKILKQILATGNFLWIHTECQRKHWWQFWKDKTKTYVVMCIK